MHDPFAMRPFFGYNFGHYLEHWLSMENVSGAKLPKIFHVNWFRKSQSGKFLWPGFGDNVRVLDWILKRVENQSNTAQKTPIGYIPADNAMLLNGLKEDIDLKELFDVPKDFWQQEVLFVSLFLFLYFFYFWQQ